VVVVGTEMGVLVGVLVGVVGQVVLESKSESMSRFAWKRVGIASQKRVKFGYRERGHQ
jgi:hypothetical protein